MGCTILRGLDNLPAAGRGLALTMGNFDGVHLGHQEILSAARRAGDEAGRSVWALTFDPPPAVVVAPHLPPAMLTPFDVRYRLLAEAGAEVVVVIETTPELLCVPAEEFVRDVLIARVGPRYVVEGPGFSFGKDRAGNIETLRQMAGEGGFELVEVPPATLELPGRGVVRVSSSLIRALLGSGDVAGAARCATRPFTLYGRVVGGERRGRNLEFPTANVDAGNMAAPGDGVYAGRARIDGSQFPAAISIGTRPTFGSGPRTVEVHLLDAAGQFYRRDIAVTFLARLRDQRKFPDAKALRAQIARDIERVREICR